MSSDSLLVRGLSLFPDLHRLLFAANAPRIQEARAYCLEEGDIVALRGSQKPNGLAIAGFLAPFVAAGITGLLLLGLGEDLKPFKVSIAYLTVTPLILLAGIVLSLKSIPLVEELGDKDYAYSGLILNILFLIVYTTSLIYFYSPSN